MSRAVARRPYTPPTGQAAIPLEQPINEALAALNKATGAWHAIEPLLTAFVPVLKAEVEGGQDAEHYFSRKTGKEVTRGEWVREVAADLVAFLEKLSRTSVNLVKVTDEAVRLRELLTGGEALREDVAALGDAELQDLLVETVLARGLWRLIRQRAKDRGVSLEAEVVSSAIEEK